MARPVLEPAETDPPDWEDISGYATAMVQFTDATWQLVHLNARRQDTHGQWWYHFWWGDNGTIRYGWYRHDPDRMQSR